MKQNNKIRIGNLIGEIIRVNDEYITLEFPGSFEKKEVNGRLLTFYIPRLASYQIDYFNKLKKWFNP